MESKGTNTRRPSGIGGGGEGNYFPCSIEFGLFERKVVIRGGARIFRQRGWSFR